MDGGFLEAGRRKRSAIIGRIYRKALDQQRTNATKEEQRARENLRASRLGTIQDFLLEQPDELQTEGPLVLMPALGVGAVEARPEVLGFEQEVDLLEEVGLVATPEDDAVEVEDAGAAELGLGVVWVEGVACRAAAGVAGRRVSNLSGLRGMVWVIPKVRF